MKFDFLG